MLMNKHVFYSVEQITCWVALIVCFQLIARQRVCIWGNWLTSVRLAPLRNFACWLICCWTCCVLIIAVTQSITSFAKINRCRNHEGELGAVPVSRLISSRNYIDTNTTVTITIWNNRSGDLWLTSMVFTTLTRLSVCSRTVYDYTSKYRICDDDRCLDERFHSAAIWDF